MEFAFCTRLQMFPDASSIPMKFSPLFLPIVLAALSSHLSAADTKSVDDFRADAAKANAVLTIPDWERTPETVDAAMKDAIAKANAALDQIGAQDPGKVTFKSTVVALDDLTYQAGIAANRATIIKETNTNPAMRSAAENAVKAFQDWAVGIDYREDVYKAIKAFADTHPKLSGEDEKLLKETLRDYRRAGLELSPDKRKEVEQLRKELAKLGTDFDTNIVSAKTPVVFTKAELDGLPDSFFASPGIKTGDDAYTVMANVTWQFNTVQENAKSDAENSNPPKMKAADKNHPNAKIGTWDWRYYNNQLNKQKFAVDKEALRSFFPFQKVLDGMFAIYQSIFGLKFEKITAPYKWIDDLQLYVVTDSASGEPLGMFYLDM